MVAEALGVQVKEFPWMFHPLLPYQSLPGTVPLA